MVKQEEQEFLNECSFTILVPFTNKKTPVETPVKTTAETWGVRV